MRNPIGGFATSKYLSLTAAVCSLFPAMAAAQDGDYKTIALNFHLMSRAKTMGEVIEENPTAVFALDLISSSVGCTGCVTAAANIITTLHEKVERNDTLRGNMEMPQGYSYCTSYKGKPQSQTDKTTFSLFLKRYDDEDLLHWVLFASVRPFVEGRRTWVDRQIHLVFVHDDLAQQARASGKCDILDFGNFKNNEDNYQIFYQRGRKNSVDNVRSG